MTKGVRTFTPGLGRYVFVGLGALAGLGLGPAPVAAATVTPTAPAARNYFAPHQTTRPRQELAQQILRDLTIAAKQRNAPPPEVDLRLMRLTADLLPHLDHNQMPSVGLQEFLMSHHGIGEMPPHLVVLKVVARNSQVRKRLVAELAAELGPGPPVRVGVAVDDGMFETGAVLALSRPSVQMLPVPRQLAPEASALIAGTLSSGFASPEVHIATPDGRVRAPEVRVFKASFRSQVACDAGAGVYRVEVAARAAQGKQMLANFPVHCGVSPPTQHELVLAGRPETTDPEEAQALVLEAVNQARAAFGKPPVTRDGRLAGAALEHSRTMARRGTVQHSRTSTSRGVDVAGTGALVVLENVASGPSLADIHASLMSSPAHRANILDDQVTRLGIGVVTVTHPDTRAVLYLTQLFAR